MALSSWKEHYWYSVPIMRTRIEEIVRLSEARGKRVLDIGCNEGFVSKALLEDGADVLSADISPEMVAKARDIFGIDVVLADIHKLPFHDKHFDVVVASEVLEHTFNPFDALSEVFRVAREKVVISLPVGEYWLGEKTHQWELNGSFIDHDSKIFQAPKHILVLSWTRRRDGSWKDIPPFNTAELIAKYNIS